jgi:hypothetical protein
MVDHIKIIWNVALKNIVGNPNSNFHKVPLPVLDPTQMQYRTQKIIYSTVFLESCLVYVREHQDI